MKVPKKNTKKDSVDQQKGNQNMKKPAMKTIKDNSGPQKPTKSNSKPAKKAWPTNRKLEGEKVRQWRPYCYHGIYVDIKNPKVNFFILPPGQQH